MRDLSFNEILTIKDAADRKRYIEYFYEEIDLMGLSIDDVAFSDRLGDIARLVFEDSLRREIDAEYNDADRYSFYPSHKVLKSQRDILCSLCEEKIIAGTNYVYYRPMLYNRQEKVAYVLDNPIKSKESCNHYLPETYGEFKELFYNIENASNLNDEDHLFPNNLPENGNHVSFVEASKHLSPKMLRLGSRK